MHITPAEARAAEMFAIDVLTDGGHEMSVPLSDGQHRRHLRFRRPDTSLYWFDLVTWPGVLVFDGDMGTWVFRRQGTDMLRFFAGTRINPGYWAEKVQAGKAREVYDPENPDFADLDPSEDDMPFTHHFLYTCFAIQWGVNRYLGLPQPDLSDLTATLVSKPLDG